MWVKLLTPASSAAKVIRPSCTDSTLIPIHWIVQKRASAAHATSLKFANQQTDDAVNADMQDLCVVCMARSAKLSDFQLLPEADTTVPT